MASLLEILQYWMSGVILCLLSFFTHSIQVMLMLLTDCRMNDYLCVCFIIFHSTL